MNTMLWGGGLWFFVCLVPICGLFYALYFFVSLPLRRQERARLFLDLLETGLKQGHSLERTIVSVAEAGDRSLGVRIHFVVTGKPGSCFSYWLSLHLLLQSALRDELAV